MKKLLNPLIFLLLIFSVACSHKIKKKNDSSEDTIIDLYFDSITVTSSGGFTGTTTGFLIEQNRNIYVQYHRPNKPYNEKFIRQTTVDSIKTVFQKVHESKIMDDQYNQPGNMTYSIKLRKGDFVNTISWADAQDSIETYVELYRYLRDFASGKK